MRVSVPMLPHSAWILAARLVSMALLVGASLPAAGGRTSPDLFLESARAVTGRGGIAVRLEGSVLGADLAEMAYPLQILVWMDQPPYTFVHLELDQGPVIGASPALADGLSPAEAIALPSAGVSLTGARIVLVAETRIEVWIPTPVGFQPTRAVVFAVDDGEIVMSNAAPISEWGTP